MAASANHKLYAFHEKLTIASAPAGNRRNMVCVEEVNMNSTTLDSIIDASIGTAVRERSSVYPILPVARAVNLALSASQAAEEKSVICRMVCDRGIRRGMVLQFYDE